MPESRHRRTNVLRRFSNSRGISKFANHHETTPLLPLTIPDLKDDAKYSDKGGPIHLPIGPGHENYYITMNSPISPVGKQPRKASVLGASRKVVSSAVRKPLRAVGRAVSRRGRSRNGDGLILEDDDDLVDEGQEVIMDEANGYGALAGDVEDSGGTSGGIVGGQSPRVGVIQRGSRTLLEASTGRRDADWPVHSMEQLTRTLVLACGAYILGCKHPEWEVAVGRLTEYALTAWATCVLIIGLAFIQRNFAEFIPGLRGSEAGAEQVLVLSDVDRVPMDHLPAAPKLDSPLVSVQRELPPEALEHPEEIGRSVSVDESVTSTTPDVPLSHPALSSLYIINATNGERIYVNTAEPTHLSTEWFEMDMVVIIRTPDVDDPKAEKGMPCNKQWSDYMRGRQRRFEFQYQLKLKKIPVGKAVYFSCELEEPIKMGMIQRAFVGAAMAFMKSTNPTFHYSITGSKERTPDGKFEKPHMSFTVEGSLDRLVVTRPGETPPKLGTAIEEDPESIKRRKKGIPVAWNLEDTYTMALWSAYVDFIDWRVINLPGIRPFGLSSVLGSQAFHLTMYLVDENRANEKHNQKDLTYVVDLELSNDEEAGKGPFAMKWMAENARKVKQELHRSRTASEDQRKLPIEARNEPAAQELLASRSADENVEEVEDDDDAETAAELGEGIYMRSGDSVCLRELLGSVDDDSGKSSFLANGGGFAVLQDQDVTIVIEKTRRSKKNRLIKSGDTVMFKLIQRTKAETRYLTIHRGWWLKWVSSVPSKNGFFTIYNHDGEFDKADPVGAQTGDAQSLYLTMGCSFVLRHKRWSSYYVGVAGEPSATYGGRMLGLYNPKKTEHTTEEQYQSDEEEPDEGDPELKASKPTWMKPLVLTAIEPQTLSSPLLPTSPRSKLESNSAESDENVVDTSAMFAVDKLTFCSEHAHADVPAWIEMMNRTDRVRQLTYVVRVTQRVKDEQKSDDDGEDLEPIEKDPETFLRLRTGRELAQIMSVGHSVRHYVLPEDLSPSNRRKSERRMTGSYKEAFASRGASSRQVSSNSENSSAPLSGLRKEAALLTLSPHEHRPEAVELPAEFSFESLPLRDDESDEESIESGIEVENVEADDAILQAALDEADEEGEEIEGESEVDTEPGSDDDIEVEAEVEVEPHVEAEVEVEPQGEERKKKGMVSKSKALIGKSVKATAGGVVKTAKLGVKTTKLTGKVALATGKLSAKAVKGTGKLTGKAAVGTAKVAFRGGKKAVNVGRSAGRAVIAPVSRKSKKPPKAEPKTKHKEKDHVAVSKKLKKIAKIEKKSASFVAGELCAPEQSRRTASRVLSRMSSLPMNAPHWKQCNAVLKSQVQHKTDQDRWFLEGTSVELGVIPLSGESSRGKLIHESLVARCLWESHWREEWSGVYDSCLSFYSPLSKAPCTEIAYIDITGVRPLDPGPMAPLPGFPLLVLETAWLCHYIAFRDEESRDTFGHHVEVAIEAHIKQVEESASIQEPDLRKARFWQGFQSLSESSLSSGVGKWAKLSSKDKLRERAVLNGRRMAFDSLDPGLVDLSNGFAFVEDLLARALSFSLDSLENDPDSFVEFLDLSSQLRLLPLDELDLSSKSTFCLFANIYHCLLQQAMLLSVNGPLHKKSVNQFMRTTCYEIGGDVFSLAELYCCVLRGKMSKPINPKPPYIEAPKKSQPYRHYALDCTDPRINFVLNTGDVACPRDVPILRPSMVEHQLNEAAEIFLQQELEIDSKKSVVILPKICEIYKNDFGGDSASCLKFCMGGLDEGTASTIRVMMMDSNLVIRYQHTAEQYHTSLKLREEDVVEGQEV